MNKNVIVGKTKQVCATLLRLYGVITKNQKHVLNSQYLHCRGRIQQGQGMANLAARKQLAYWERKSG